MAQEPLAPRHVSQGSADFLGGTVLENHSHAPFHAHPSDETIVELVGKQQPAHLRKTLLQQEELVHVVHVKQGEVEYDKPILTIGEFLHQSTLIRHLLRAPCSKKVGDETMHPTPRQVLIVCNDEKHFVNY